jgi:tRNA-specific 2-thiouridylase
MGASSVRVIVGLSGGVDSAVAALLLRQQGYDVEGLFMVNWEEDDAYCTTAADYQDARAVARELRIPLHRVNFAQAYRTQVFSYFLQEYRVGRTPNPDVLCNREIKFGLCSVYADRLGADLFATGHYARCELTDDGPALYRALDHAKDQSYFLHAVPRERFARVKFPLGALCKDAVREHARRAGLPVCDKPDSTGICFIGERPFAEFLARYLPAQSGPIETLSGQRLGTHRGLPFYTLGQRAGLEIGGARGFPEEPWYVADKQPERNALIVVQRHDAQRLETRQVRTGAMHWLAPARSQPFTAGVKLRYRQSDQPARVTLSGESLRLDFEEPQRAATAGQFAVLYDGDRCLGGAVIEQAAIDCPMPERQATA